MKFFFGIIFISFSAKFYSQVTAADYSFIKQEVNHLYFSNDSTAFLNFYQKLDKLREDSLQNINIVHFGGSHVQGGIWSNRFLINFQEEYKTSGGGYFYFPYNIGKTNSQPYLKSFSNGTWKLCRAVKKDFCLPLGMNALSIGTNDSANYFGVVFTKWASCKKVNVVKLYHNFNASFEFSVSVNDSIHSERKDYAELGYTEFKFNHRIDSVNFQLQRKDTLQKDFVVFGFSLENESASGFYLAGLGANGATSVSFLRSANLVQQLSTLKSDLVILSLGVNDTQADGFEKNVYVEHYDSLITFVKAANPNSAIILTTTTDNYIKSKNPNRRTVSAREAMFELMEKHSNVAVWDLFTLMGGYKSMPKWLEAGLASKDKVHFSTKGYVLLGNLMYEAVNKSYNNNRKKEKQ
ncbi:MAG: hypothetical protein KF900_07310 [Bacteroidetes bacterium]|nr:hypothetical protein [Bacteroidota bacterium]